MQAPRNPIHRLAWLAAATAAYFVAGRLGLAVAFFHSSVSPVWPASGLALAAMILYGEWLWPAVALGAFIVNCTVTGHVPSSLGIALGNTGEAVAGAWFVRRFAGGTGAFDHPLTFFRYLGGGLAACAISATVGVLSLMASRLAAWHAFGPVWLTWLTGDFMSVCSFAPFLILWGRDRRLRMTAARRVEALLLFACVTASGWVLFGRTVPFFANGVPTEFLEVPPLLWAAFRFGQRGAAAAVQIMTVLAVWGTLNGHGPFADSDVNTSLLQLQFFIGMLSVTMMLLAAVLTSQRGTERDLQVSEERFRQIAENIREVFYVSEPEWPGVVYVSPAFESVWGRRREDLYRKPELLMQSVHSDDAPAMTESLARQIRGEETTLEYRVVRPDGTERWVIDRAFPVKDAAGRVTRITGVATDITERKRAEEKLRTVEDQLRHAQKMEAVGRLAGGIAHDFNNLLTAVNGYAELLLGRLEEEGPNRGFAAEILRAGERGAAVTQQLLAFSRKQLTSPVVLDANGVIMNMQKMIGRLIGAETPVDFELGADLPQTRIDPGQVSQAVMNLVINAKDAMPLGGRVSVETFKAELSGEEPDYFLRPAPGTYACIRVKDEGKGMDEGVMTHLFEPYFTTKEKGKGTGLGLCTVYGIVEQLRGGIRVETAENRGSSFYLYLPQAQPEGAPRETRPETAARPQSGRKGTVLVVEDEESVRKLVKLTLVAQGFRVLEAEGERDAMRLHERYHGPIDLLLTDVVLPGKSGREIAKAFASLRPGMRVMFMSGYAEDPLLSQSIEKTGAVFLGKPFTPVQLLAKVMEALEKEGVTQSVSAEDPSWTPSVQ
jgi:PAS domain S-box-containing protein